MVIGRSRKRLLSDALQRLADEELIELVRGGDPRAFEVLYDRHSAAAYSLAYRMMGSAGAAQDVTQEAFLSLWRSSGRYDPARASVRTWLLSVVHHRGIDALRRSAVHGRRRAQAEGVVEQLEAPERTDAEAARRQQARSMRSVLDELPGDQRRVVELAYFGGLTHSEIAELLAVPLGTVKGRMRLALDKLRVALDESEALA